MSIFSVGSPYLENQNSLFHQTFTQDEAYQDMGLYSFWWQFMWPSWLGDQFAEKHQMGITLRLTVRIDHMIA